VVQSIVVGVTKTVVVQFHITLSLLVFAICSYRTGNGWSVTSFNVIVKLVVFSITISIGRNCNELFVLCPLIGVQ
jgi:hypothetical protein